MWVESTLVTIDAAFATTSENCVKAPYISSFLVGLHP